MGGRRLFNQFADQHGFDVVFHSLRHMAAILMLSSGVDVKTTASRLGHADPGMLVSTYSHFIQSADRAAADRIESAIVRSGEIRDTPYRTL